MNDSLTSHSTAIHQNHWYTLWGGFTMTIMKFKLQGPFQGPEWGPSNVFTFSYVFEDFSKIRYFDHDRLIIN